MPAEPKSALSNISSADYCKNRSAHAPERRSIVPHNADEIHELAEFFQSRRTARKDETAYLVAPSGERQEIPAEVFTLLSYIAESLSAGKGITVMPTHTKLTTQQAADHLGISRPTLIKLLELGEIPFTKVGRHRRVTLEDLIEYECTAQEERSRTLQEFTAQATSQGMYFNHPDTSKTR